MAATWILCWRVSDDGETLDEYRASLSDDIFTVRRVGASRGGEECQQAWFDHFYGETPQEAIDKYLKRQRVIARHAKSELEIARLRVRRGEVLLAKENAAEVLH